MKKYFCVHNELPAHSFGISGLTLYILYNAIINLIHYIHLLLHIWYGTSECTMRGIIWLEITLCHVTKRVCGLHSENAVTFLFGLSTAQFPITHKRCTDSNLLLLVYTRQYPSVWHRYWNMASFHNINALVVHVMSYWYRKSICGDKTSLRLRKTYDAIRYFAKSKDM